MGACISHMGIWGPQAREHTKQVTSNIQSLIKKFANIMLRQMKGIGDGQQDVRLLILDMLKSLHERSNEVHI